MISTISNIEKFGQYIFAVIGGLFAIIQPTMPLILVSTLAVFADCLTAWSLAKRVKSKYGKNDGYFKSEHFGRVFTTLIKVYAIIILSYLIDVYVLDFADMSLANITAGAVCFWQIWSILENESSCNNAKWAKIAQKIMVDKTERHFNIDLSELKEDGEEQEQKED